MLIPSVVQYSLPADFMPVAILLAAFPASGCMLHLIDCKCQPLQVEILPVTFSLYNISCIHLPVARERQTNVILTLVAL